MARDGSEVLGVVLRLVCDRCAVANEQSQFSDWANLSVAYQTLIEIAPSAGWTADKESGAVVCPACRMMC